MYPNIIFDPVIPPVCHGNLLRQSIPFEAFYYTISGDIKIFEMSFFSIEKELFEIYIGLDLIQSLGSFFGVEGFELFQSKIVMRND